MAYEEDRSTLGEMSSSFTFSGGEDSKSCGGMPSSSNTSRFALFGTISSAVRSSALLWEPFRRLPAKPKMFYLFGSCSPPFYFVIGKPAATQAVTLPGMLYTFG